MIIDSKATTFGLHKSLIIPIGAKSKKSIEDFVGKIDRVFGNDSAFLVSFAPIEDPNEFKIWTHKRSFLLNHQTQLWVDVNYNNYRKVYMDIFGQTVKDKQVVDHIMNRKLARSLGYRYFRLLHISRSCNSSGGRGGESFANKLLPVSLSINSEINSSQIVYADPMDLLKMLNFNVGGFGLEAVRDNHFLIYGS